MTQILKTSNYAMFKLADTNRKVKKSHVELLKKAIRKKNLLHLNPIIVDQDSNVIDGQHRLTAARELKLPIFYMIDNEINDSDIASLNSNKSNWQPLDYINYYARKGNNNYKQLSAFIK